MRCHEVEPVHSLVQTIVVLSASTTLQSSAPSGATEAEQSAASVRTLFRVS